MYLVFYFVGFCVLGAWGCGGRVNIYHLFSQHLISLTARVQKLIHFVTVS